MATLNGRTQPSPPAKTQAYGRPSVVFIGYRTHQPGDVEACERTHRRAHSP
jgi:hypothetical protein